MKKLILVMMLFSLVLPVTANASAARSIGIRPGIVFDGTTARCTVSITGNTGNDKIAATISFSQGNSNISTWTASGTGYLNSQQNFNVIKGKEYTLTVNATINGTPQPSKSFSKVCN